MSWLPRAALLSILPVAGAAFGAADPMPAEARRDCSRVEHDSAASKRIVEACLVWGESSNTLIVRDASGRARTIATGEPVYPWADVHLLPRAGPARWLLVIYKSDVDRPDGTTFFVEVYSLDVARKVLDTYVADVQVEPGGPGRHPALIAHEVLVPLRYSIQLGWPRVYELSDVLRPIPLQQRPDLIAAFIARAATMASNLRFICKELPQPCQYAADIELIAAQIRLARAAAARPR